MQAARSPKAGHGKAHCRDEPRRGAGRGIFARACRERLARLAARRVRGRLTQVALVVWREGTLRHSPQTPARRGGVTDSLSVPVQVKDRDEQLAKAKRMMVALNNKFKAKFAKMEETYKAKAAAPGEGEGSAPSLELQEARDKLAAAQRAVQELQQALAAERARGAGGENDGEIAELQEAVEERDAIIEKAKEKYQEMGRKARAAVEERDAEIATLQEQLQQAEQKLEEALGAAAASASSDEALAQMQASLDEANAALSVAQCSCSEAQQVLILNKYLLSIVT